MKKGYIKTIAFYALLIIAVVVAVSVSAPQERRADARSAKANREVIGFIQVNRGFLLTKAFLS